MEPRHAPPGLARPENATQKFWRPWVVEEQKRYDSFAFCSHRRFSLEPSAIVNHQREERPKLSNLPQTKNSRHPICPERIQSGMPARRRIIRFIAVIQSILFLTHIFIYETWTFSPASSVTHGSLWLKLVLGVLSVSFVSASLLAYRYTTAAVRIFYRAAAVWAGILSFLFL